MSHCGISDVITVRLYDSQDLLKTDISKKTHTEFYISYICEMIRDCEPHAELKQWLENEQTNKNLWC